VVRYRRIPAGGWSRRPRKRGGLHQTGKSSCRGSTITICLSPRISPFFAKDFSLPGSQRFKAEIDNLFNSVSWQSVDTSGQFNPTTGQQTDRNFGSVIAARTERRMVFGLRYTF
jgi:hypothetical protein